MENLKLHANGKSNHRNDLLKEMGKKIKTILDSQKTGEGKSKKILDLKNEYAKKIKDLEDNLY